MFWDKGYAPSANIEALLEKENSKLEEFLDEEDILQECKTQKKTLVNYFTRADVIRRLVELITTEPSDDLPMVQRFRYANMSCEILTLGLPSLDEKLLSDADTIQLLYSYLEKEPPLNPLLSSFFSKTFSMLFTKKPEQDWFSYQHMCLQLLEYIKSQKTFLDFICKHFDTPVIPDLIMQMMKDIEGGQLKRNLFEWLTEDKIVERLIAILRNPQETDKHANVADFFCDLINQGRLMRQTEQENDSFEPAFDGSNPILKTIESADTIEALLNVILEPNAQESAILSGISVVLTLIKPITFTDEPNSDRQRLLQKREREFHQEVQETVITVMAPRLQEFVHVLKNPPAKSTIETTAAVLTPPFGKTRLQVCRVFTALLETKHESIQQAICATEYFSLLLEYFKQYCWNNFLHTETEKALHLVFYNELSNNNTASTEATDFFTADCLINAFLKVNEEEFDVELKNALNDYKREEGGNNVHQDQDQDGDIEIEVAAAQEAAVQTDEQTPTIIQEANPQESPEEPEPQTTVVSANEETAAPTLEENHVENNLEDDRGELSLAADKSESETTLNDLDKTKEAPNALPSEMQTHLIVNCHLISKLIDFWQHNAQAQSVEKGRRLGYMGHLIKILRHITNCISESEHIAALMVTSLRDEAEQQLWQSLIDAETGEFTLAAKQQNQMLANCNPHEDHEYNAGGSKDYLGETNSWDIGTLSYSNMGYSDLDNTLQDIVFTMDNDQNLFQFGRNIDDEDDDEDEQGTHSGAGDGHSHGMFTKNSITLSNLADTWDMDVQFSDIPGASTQVNTGTENWGTEFNTHNFADFDAHFSTFGSDLGMPTSRPPVDEESQSVPDILAPTPATVGDEKESHAHNDDDDDEPMSPKAVPDNASSNDQQAEYDNNANVEKSSSDKLASEASVVEATSIVTRLQSVLLDGEDDYEDDEGMWTKPLGGDRETEDQSTPISNGPTSKVNEFNHANDNGSSNNVDGHEESNITATAEQQKLTAASANKTNNVEIATHTT
ncbi:serine/threonine-protein phosphatase 6 regulatory subunit 3 [Drosophila pseudoobscura]|uniref:Serine/threonine-protein phosphatase 6 regulatory subunit 3 n=1 Tax=Drosophila pseudoobscura pseudoobscura TaxID=46245 RepID=A0A6I8WE85_DROPS|nr:serine/threonine-protein phosphatase 6 regulatory subunit 3 [Drosophila pseudoobscura]XP_033241538.1 serine/threonine-protein phosphatase 6 regulatory subunit 3 [Drosophila pseudoobscura]